MAQSCILSGRPTPFDEGSEDYASSPAVCPVLTSHEKLKEPNSSMAPMNHHGRGVNLLRVFYAIAIPYGK